jgi:hypothetical protein
MALDCPFPCPWITPPSSIGWNPYINNGKGHSLAFSVGWAAGVTTKIEVICN